MFLPRYTTLLITGKHESHDLCFEIIVNVCGTILCHIVLTMGVEGLARNLKSSKLGSRHQQQEDTIWRKIPGPSYGRAVKKECVQSSPSSVESQ